MKKIFYIMIIFLSIFIFGCSNKKSVKNNEFKQNIVFYIQHQDDETLWASSAINQAINQVGADNVYIVQVSYGTGIKIFNDKKFENMSKIEKYEYREREFLAAVNQLGIKKENVILIPRMDLSEISNFQMMENIALSFEQKLKDVTHIAHTYKLDWHLQHLKNGAIIQSLYNAGIIKDARYFIKPEYEKYIPDKDKLIYKSTSSKDKEKIKRACEEYKVVNDNRYGIGYKSDHKSFDRLMKSYYSILHTPNI